MRRHQCRFCDSAACYTRILAPGRFDEVACNDHVRDLERLADEVLGSPGVPRSHVSGTDRKVRGPKGKAPDVLAAANAVLASFENGRGWNPGRLTLERRDGGLWLVSTLCRPAAAKRFALRAGDRAWPTFRYGSMGMGGTDAIAVSQIVRWVRGMTRRPLVCWRYWCGPTVGLGTPGTIPLLEAGGYADPAMTSCVVCGKADPTDWFGRDGVTGPCCRWAVCEGNRNLKGA